VAITVPVADVESQEERQCLVGPASAEPSPPPPGTADSGGVDVFQAVHSFLFGDGSSATPPRDRNELWLQVGRHIVAHRGALTTEALLPFVPSPPALSQAPPAPRDPSLPPGGSSITESERLAVAEVLAHFRGRPVRTDAGTIMLQFPELSSPECRRTLPPANPPERYLHEEDPVFSQQAPRSVWIGLGLGLANLCGVLWLRHALATGWAPEGPATPLVRGLLGFLLAYAAAFLLVPALRWAVLKGANAMRQERNRRRRWYADHMATPGKQPSSSVR